MTAYGALISLENTITDIWKSHDHSPFNEMLKAAYVELQPLQEILGRLDGSSKSKSRKKVNALDGRIKDALWNFEDFLENLLSDIGIHTLPESSYEFERLRQPVDSLIQTLKDMKEEYIHEIDNMPEDNDDGDGDEAAVISSTSTSAGMKSRMIGLSDQFEQVKSSLAQLWYGSITSDAFVGMAGIGKTTLAMKIYEDPQIRRCYDCRVWIRVGREYDIDQAIDLAAQLKSNGGEKCLIVLDDVWETGVLPVILTEIEGCCPFIRVLITARGRNVTRQVDYIKSPITETVLWFLNEEESKDLLCYKVFGEREICPPLLDKAATKIAKNCEGLPLMILTVAQRLSSNRDLDYWNDVAEERNSVFTDSYEEISKVLFPSYDYLPQRLKMPFMFMGVFPRDHDIPISKILNMWTAEGWLLDPNKHHSLEVSATKCLEELSMTYNLVLFKPKSSDWYLDYSFDMLITCRLHSSWRHLCRRQAQTNKFFHVLKKLVDASSPTHSWQQQQDLAIKGQRGLCLENNLLFGLKEFCNSINSHHASSVHSLLFFGPYHQYPTPIIGFKLLRELDALQLRFYTFPTQILTLFQLKYLALTCNDQLPSTISKLSKLQTLIMHPHLSIIKCHTSPSFIPIEIWDMAELEHIEILGKSLRASNNAHACLRKLSTLVSVNVNVGAISELSERIPNIRKLGVQMELTPYHDTTSTPDLILSSFDSISTLDNLETLKFSIMNPMLVRSPLLSRSSSLMFPSELKKLHLSGVGFPWEYMRDAIASLPYLQVLKLRCHAFRGPKWEPQEGSFSRLEYLAIEDSDLVQWKPASGSFPELNHLSLKHCYKLQELDWPSDSRYVKIELVDCNPLSVACANRLPSKHRHSLSVAASDHYHA